MKKITILLSAIIALAMASCNNLGFNKTTVSPASESINGPLGDYFSITNRDYKVTDDMVRIELQRTQDGFPSPWTKDLPLGYSEGCFEPAFMAEFLDETGNVVATSTTDVATQMDELRFLAANRVDESSTITFHINGDKVKQVRIGSLFTIHEAEDEVGTEEIVEDEVFDTIENVLEQTDDFIEQDEALNNEDEFEEAEPVSVSSGKNWDKFLDEYEEYVDQYIRLVKKAANGDISAMVDYVSMLEKAENIENELDKAQGEMTTAQLKRYAKITQKMTDAALEMQ